MLEDARWSTLGEICRKPAVRVGMAGEPDEGAEVTAVGRRSATFTSKETLA